MDLVLDAVRAAVRAVATRPLDWAAPPPAPVPLRLITDGDLDQLRAEIATQRERDDEAVARLRRRLAGDAS